MLRCRICGHQEHRILYQLTTGNIVRCLGCQTVFRSNLVVGADHYALYQNKELMETPFYITNKLASDPNQEPLRTYARGLTKLHQLGVHGRLLDVGCSYGAFMESARARGWETVGVELSANPAAFARASRGLNVFNGPVEAARFPARHFQAITLWDVIEHFDDPLGTLAELDRILAVDGVLLVFTINQASLLNTVGDLVYRATCRKWHRLMSLFYDIHHNFFFTPRTLAAVVLRAGRFEIADIDFGAANVRRWHTVPIPSLMIWGSDLIDWLGGLVRRRYRLLLYAHKLQ